ncbi:MAG TPA: NEW3 domain-containing protein [Bacillota bacterium]|nr:NEW3 domain-containing protein [Bacillota bacterium]
MRSKARKAAVIFLMAVLVMGVQSLPSGPFTVAGNSAYGAIMLIKSTSKGADSAVQGEDGVPITVEVQNQENKNFTFDSATLGISNGSGISISGGPSGTTTLAKNQTSNFTFYLDIGGADTGERTLSLTLRNGNDIVHENGALGRLTIYEKMADVGKGSGTGSVATLDITHKTEPEEGFDSGRTNTLILELFNNGSSVFRNAEISLTMPDGLSLDNASNSTNLGYISVGSRRTVSFPITVDDDAKSKTYGITVKVTGLNYSGDSVGIEKTFYVPVNGSGGSLRDAEINITGVPSQVSGQDEFVLSFDVKNPGSSTLKDVKVNVDVPDGLLNKTRSTFIESSIPAKGSKSYSVTMFAADGAKEKAYPIKISLSSSASTEDADAVIQYASVYVSASSGEKTPQLMVDSYSYGGTFVQAGSEFVLDLGLYNTSGSHTISNIKVTVSAEDGAIIPVNSSNSFYIDKLGKKERIDKAMHFSVKPGAEQKTTPLTVDMSYEDAAGNPFTSKDTISIPVMQETKLEVDDVIAPPELYAGMQSGVSVQFYNMGKTTLNNLRVTAEGDFDTPESTSYFAGNMESGKSDTYDFSFIPRQGGTMEGKIIFTYEDASGDQQVLERPFSFQVMAEMPAFDDGMPPMDDGAGAGGISKKKVILAILILLAAVGIFVWRKIRKKKRNRELEINE